MDDEVETWDSALLTRAIHRTTIHRDRDDSIVYIISHRTGYVSFMIFINAHR